MTTKQIAELYIEHAAYFRELLEKRAKAEKEEEDKAAKIAADLIKNCHRPMMTIPGPDPEEITEARVREIAREEIARTKVYWMGVDPAVVEDRTVTSWWSPALGADDSKVVWKKQHYPIPASRCSKANALGR